MCRTTQNDVTLIQIQRPDIKLTFHSMLGSYHSQKLKRIQSRSNASQDNTRNSSTKTIAKS